MKNFGEFFRDQSKTSATVIFSRTQLLSAERIEKSRALVEEQHPGVRIVTTPWDDLSADTLLEVIESGKPMEIHLDDDDDDDDEDEHDHHHHHHDHDDDDDEHEHHHHHHDGECCCGHHHHHHDHDADEVFTSWGHETAHKYSHDELESILTTLDSGEYGAVLRAKGIVDGGDTWYEFDMVPGEHEIRTCGPDVTGKVCVIGSQLKEHEVEELFHA